MTLVLIGVIAGLGGGLLMELLHLVEHVAFSQPHASGVLQAASAAPPYRRLVSVLAAAVIVVAGLWALGRASTGGVEITEAIWLSSGRLPLLSSIARGVISIVTIGMGVSLGREAAPQLLGAASASQLAERAGLPVWQRRLLVACGAGAGFAAVYNVPLGGALIALEVMLGTLALPLVLPALLTSSIATAVSWLIIGQHVLYQVPVERFTASQIGYAVLIAPIAGCAAYGWTRLIAAANRVKPRRAGRYLAPFIAFAVLGLLSLEYPQLLGNGHGIVQLVLIGKLSLGLIVVLLVLKPLVVTICLGSGAPGGLFTPTMSVGVLLAAFVAWFWLKLWPGSPLSVDALIGCAAFLAAAIQGPLAGAVLVLELTGHMTTLLVPTLIAVAGATAIARGLGSASIYSARLQTGSVAGEKPSVYASALAALAAPDEPDEPESASSPDPAGRPAAGRSSDTTAGAAAAAPDGPGSGSSAASETGTQDNPPRTR